MRRVIFNQKGGVGKTSISCNLAAISAAHGFKTLLIDLDIQGNSSGYLLGEEYRNLQDNAATFFKQFVSMLNRKKAATHYIYQTQFDNLCVMPSHPDLASIERDLESRHKIYKLRNELDELSATFQHIYIDTPPAYNFYTNSAMIAADSLLVPFDCDRFSLDALYGLMEVVNDIQEDHNSKLRIEGIIVNQYQAQANFHKQLIQQIVDEGLPLMEPFIPASVKMRESRDKGIPLVHYAPKHRLTQQYQLLFEKLHPEVAKAKSAAVA